MWTITEEHFDQLNWHDTQIYGFALRADEDASRLIFDVDFILEWKAEAGISRLIAPATLTFNNVNDLEVRLNYASCQVGPFEIDGIEREPARHLYKTYQWRILVSSPTGPSVDLRNQIRFIANGFVQELRAAPAWCSWNLAPGEWLEITKTWRDP